VGLYVEKAGRQSRQCQVELGDVLQSTNYTTIVGLSNGSPSNLDNLEPQKQVAGQGLASDMSHMHSVKEINNILSVSV
jgi:hypothetical protein